MHKSTRKLAPIGVIVDIQITTATLTVRPWETQVACADLGVNEVVPDCVTQVEYFGMSINGYPVVDASDPSSHQRHDCNGLGFHMKMIPDEK